MSTTSTTPPDYRIVTEHFCTTQATAALRWMKIKGMHQLQQAHQCISCGKNEWKPIEIVEG